MTGWIVMVSLSLLLIFKITLNDAHADDAEVLPKGVFHASVDTKFWFPVDERYDPNGNIENISADYNTSLNREVFPDIGLVESGFGLDAGSGTLGDSIVSFEYEYTDLILSFAYGLTDRLTIGAAVPYYLQRNDVTARIDNSNATIGKNAALKTLAPLSFPGTHLLTTEDVQNLLGNGMDVDGDGLTDIHGLGYDRVENWSDSGLADIEAGFKYQYLKTTSYRLAFTGGVRFPTGKVDDPDNLMDLEFGSGAYALLFRLHNDYTGIRNLTLNTTLSYDLVLPDKETKRVPDNVDQPITANKERVDRDIGDAFELEASGEYEFMKGFCISLLYNYSFKLKDKISGEKGFAYESLEEETDIMSHVYVIGLSYSTIPFYKEMKIFLPLSVSVSYMKKIAGSNNSLNTEYINLAVEMYF